MLCGIVVAQTAAKPVHADRVVVLKKERTLQLLSAGKVVKSYKVALGGDPVGPKTRLGDHKIRRECTFLTHGTRTVNFTSRFTFRIRTRGIVRRHERKVFLREGTCLCTGCPTGTGGSVLRTG